MGRSGRDGPEDVIEADKNYLGGEEPGKLRRGASGKALVLLAVQVLQGNEIGRIRLAHVTDASGQSLVGALETTGTPGREVKNRLAGLPGVLHP